MKPTFSKRCWRLGINSPQDDVYHLRICAQFLEELTVILSKTWSCVELEIFYSIVHFFYFHLVIQPTDIAASTPATEALLTLQLFGLFSLRFFLKTKRRKSKETSNNTLWKGSRKIFWYRVVRNVECLRFIILINGVSKYYMISAVRFRDRDLLSISYGWLIKMPLLLTKGTIFS